MTALRDLLEKATKVPNKPRTQQLMDEAELLTYLHDKAEAYVKLEDAARKLCKAYSSDGNTKAQKDGFAATRAALKGLE